MWWENDRVCIYEGCLAVGKLRPAIRRDAVSATVRASWRLASGQSGSSTKRTPRGRPPHLVRGAGCRDYPDRKLHLRKLPSISASTPHTLFPTVAQIRNWVFISENETKYFGLGVDRSIIDPIYDVSAKLWTLDRSKWMIHWLSSLKECATQTRSLQSLQIKWYHLCDHWWKYEWKKSLAWLQNWHYLHR